MRPKRAATSNALPSRRDVLAALASLGGIAAFAHEAFADAPPAPSASASASGSGHVVVLYPNMGRVVLVFKTKPFGALQVSVDGNLLSAGDVVPDGDAPASSASASPTARDPAPPIVQRTSAPAPSASAAVAAPSASASAEPSGPFRYAFFAAAGIRQINVRTENGYFANAQTNVVAGGSVDVPVDPQQEMPLGGAPPPPHFLGGAGCCGGDHGAAEARARNAVPSIGATAIAAAALLLRRGADRDR